MNPRFQSWKIKIEQRSHTMAAFEKWLFVQTAGVLFGNKPGELLMLSAEECRLGIDQQLKIITSLAPVWNYTFRVLMQDPSCVRIVFYDHDKVQEVLSKIPGWVFNDMGYPNPVEPDTFLKEVGRRWQETGQIPHEIGISLGYPIKDVLGYMGLISLPCTGICGWRIHGNPQPSLKKSREFEQAREKALAFLSI
jgi:hypothetical protein